MSCSASTACGFPRSLRLIKTSDYGVLVHVRNENTFYLASKYFSVSAMKNSHSAGRLRIGITVGKKNARRSVDRALVKRILREATRKQASNLVASLREQGLGLDVSLRLKAPFVSVKGHDDGVGALKASLHEDARVLIERLSKRVHKLSQLPLRGD